MSDDNEIKTVYFKGPCEWAKLFPFNRDKGKYAPEDGQYTITIGLDEANTAMVKGWNRLYEGSAGDEGLQYFQFKRKHKHVTKAGKEIEAWGGAPRVVDADGAPWTNEDGKTALIGNGSICTVKLNVATVNGMNFVRLEGVRVDEHVEYVSVNSGPDGDTVHGDIPF